MAGVLLFLCAGTNLVSPAAVLWASDFLMAAAPGSHQHAGAIGLDSAWARRSVRGGGATRGRRSRGGIGRRGSTGMMVEEQCEDQTMVEVQHWEDGGGGSLIGRGDWVTRTTQAS
jgi:hypothetical protein